MHLQRIASVTPCGATGHRPLRRSQFVPGWRGSAGIALTEILVGIAIITIVAATSLWALGAANRLATVNRNFTGAKTLAQNKVDEVLCTAYPVSSVPAVLNAGTTNELVTINPGPPSIMGTMTTNVSVTDAALNIRQVRVTVAYPYNGKVYSVSMATARSPD